MTFYEKLAAGKKIDYVVIGDSIGRGSGAENESLTWFSQLEKLLSSHYNVQFNRHSIVQSGATAFEGIVKMEKESLPSDFDIAFIVFGENDRKYMSDKQFAYFYELLIRKIKEHNPDSEIVTITESCLSNQNFAEVIKTTSDYYKTVHIDMRIPFDASGLSIKELTKDGIHPNGKGYSLYAQSIFSVLEKASLNSRAISIYPPEPLHTGSDKVFTFITSIQSNNGFQYKKPYYTSLKNSDSLQYRFTGSMVGVTVLRSPNGGKVDVFIDGKFSTTLSTWWPFERVRHQYISSGLKNGEHTLRFVHSNEVKTGTVKISSIIVQTPQR
ncbi:SGNH/GDSL hydrolase family protein [Bacillus sp. cl95]|uniref:SGNH/GDSL hydrolase family protein n=2 Tax=unclassified Bacillus (in: firmicutes) TaxID=185979 RepID=UPI001C317840|nr:SGNH/GDSL hydrolase family protein [Bacillus sp. cl95]